MQKLRSDPMVLNDMARASVLSGRKKRSQDGGYRLQLRTRGLHEIL